MGNTEITMLMERVLLERFLLCLYFVFFICDATDLLVQCLLTLVFLFALRGGSEPRFSREARRGGRAASWMKSA